MFVSYAHADAPWVLAQIAWLREQGIELFHDEGMETGTVWRDAIAEAVAGCGLCLFFASPGSVASTFCQQEVEFALARRRPVLVVYVAPCELPAGLEMALGRRQALHAARFAEDELRKRVLAGIRTLLGGAGALRSPDEGDPARAIVVLPFRDIGGEAAYLAEGIAEELLTALHQVPSLRVLARTVGFACRGSDEDPCLLGQRLGADYLLEGSVRRSGQRVRVTVALVDTASRDQTWSERYDRELGELFDLQDEIADRVVRAVTRTVHGVSRPAFDWGTTDAVAYRKFLMGRIESRKFGVEAMQLACDYFRRALDTDPHFERARIALIGTLESLRLLVDDAGFAEEISAHIDIVERDDPDHDRHNWAWLERLRDPGRAQLLDLDATERMFREILSDPGHPARRSLRFDRWAGGGFVAHSDAFPEHAGRGCYGLLLAQAGLYRAALQMLYPANPTTSAIGCLLTLVGKLREARDFYRTRVEENPELVMVRVSQIALHERMGEHDAADAALERARPLLTDDVYLATRLVIAGWRDDDAAFEMHAPGVYSGNLPRFFKGMVAAYRDAELAMDWLESALARREMLLVNTHLWVPTLLPPRRHEALARLPRFRTLLSEIGIDEVWRLELRQRANSLTSVTGVRVSLDD